MTTTLIFVIAGIVLITACGFFSRRSGGDLGEWAVGGRRLGVATTWLLQAGEEFTTFTFVGLVALSFSAGTASLYALVYTPLAFLVLYFVAPMIWRKAAGRGYLTQADFFEDVYGSKAFGWLVAVFGVVFLLPYLELQITGLGDIVQFATGDQTSARWSMVAACLLIIAFVLWSGLRGVASTSYFKDAVMLVMLVVLFIALPAHFSGGIAGLFRHIHRSAPGALFVHSGSSDVTWFLSSVMISLIGIVFVTAPHNWSSILSARDPRVLRRNYVILPLYSLCLVMPVVLGFVAMAALPKGSNANAAVFTLAARALPSWVVGLVAVAGIAAAMVPAAGLLVGICPLVARNIVRASSGRGQYWVSQLSVIVLAGLALVLALVRPDSLANLLLLTFSGLAQLAPATAAALWRGGRLIGVVSAISGVIAGEVVVTVATFTTAIPTGNISVGLIGLAANIVIILAIETGLRVAGARMAGGGRTALAADAAADEA
jgi:SSS family solute:Na+ symporter